MSRNKEKIKEYNKKKILEGQNLINLKCKMCGVNVPTKEYRLRCYKNNPRYCKKCISKKSSERFKKYKKSLTKEQRKKEGLMGNLSRSKESRSNAVKKQWQNIKKNESKFKEVKKKHKERMIKVWENYPTNKKNFILTNLVNSNGNSRSKLSNEIKEKLIEYNIYEGFLSEECFHGFFPDEINLELKTIIEVYGDIYHCNPNKFKNPNEYCSWIQRTVREQWQRDRIRLSTFYKHGFDVLIIWESDWRNDYKKQIERLKNEINFKKNLR